MNKVFIILLSFFFLELCLNAQAKGPESISIAYLGETLTHPGVKVGLPILLKNSSKQKEKPKGTINKIKSFYVVPQIGFYTHLQNHSALILNVDLAFKRNKEDSKWARVYSLGIGALTQFNAGTTYIQEEDGSIKEKNGASRIYFNPSIAYELRYNIKPLLAIYSKASMGFKVPYNTFFSLNPMIELGVHVNLKNN